MYAEGLALAAAVHEDEGVDPVGGGMVQARGRFGDGRSHGGMRHDERLDQRRFGLSGPVAAAVQQVAVLLAIRDREDG